MGAVDFIEKPFREQILLESIQKAIAQDVGRRHKMADVAEVKKRITSLTAREREVVDGIIEGKANKEQIAECMLYNSIWRTTTTTKSLKK